MKLKMTASETKGAFIKYRGGAGGKLGGTWKK